MSLIDRLAWRSIITWLRRYSRADASIRHCFIRHSTASDAQNMLVSDYDLAFFVEARDFSEVRSHTIRIQRDLKKARVLDSIVLPATDAAYRLCASHYAHRSLYPMKSWRCVFGESLALSEPRYCPPPLDHSPEGFLYGYLVPAILGKTRRHPFEGVLMRRKLEREGLQLTEQPLRKSPTDRHEVVTEQIRAWDRFYCKIDFPAPDTRVPARPIRSSVCETFVDRWTSTGTGDKRLPAVSSVWVYPAFYNDRAPHVVLNFEQSVSAADCRMSLDILLRTFRGLEFSLLIGTERSMLGRLGGLNRVSLLEPWLCKTSGHCLYGDAELKDRIREPPVSEVKEKLRELFLYLSYRVFPGTSCPYSLYRTCFTLDHLFKRNELVLNGEDLETIYGRDILPESEFEGPEGKRHLLGAWRELHGLDLFGTIAMHW